LAHHTVLNALKDTVKLKTTVSWTVILNPSDTHHHTKGMYATNPEEFVAIDLAISEFRVHTSNCITLIQA